ncbi:MAG: cadherin-like beta sandwich domain-containing protein, partial [Actinomycetes bacterium]
ALPIIKGGDDILIGGAGNDFVSGDGGNDILQLGDGVDLADGGTGFDWATYNFNKRFDNAPGGRPSIFADLAGLNPNATNLGGDGLAAIEGISGSDGNDIIYGSQGENAIIPRNTVRVTNIDGVAGTTVALIQGTDTRIIAGMTAVGPGVGNHAIVMGAAQVTDIAGNTNTQITFSVENTATIIGPVTFALWPLDNLVPGNQNSITGLTNLLNPSYPATSAATPGWNPIGGLNSGPSWTGGNIIFGSAGSDLIGVNAGSNVVDGDRSLQTCIHVTKVGFAPTGLSDVTSCGGTPGYSSMSLLSPYMDNGTLHPTDLNMVREIVKSPLAAGANTDIDTIALPGTANQYTFAAIAPASLPTGVSTGYRISGPAGASAGSLPTIDTIYDVEEVLFGGITTAQDPVTGKYATAVPISDNSLSGLTVNVGTLAPAFSPSVLAYTLSVPALTTSIIFTPVVAATSTVTVNGGTAVALGGTKTVTVRAGTAVPIVVTPVLPALPSTYTVTPVFTPVTPVFGLPVASANGFTAILTNCSASYTYTATTATPGAVATWASTTCTGLTRTLNVTGVAPGGTAQIDVVATRTNYANATATVIGSATQGTFNSTPNPTIGGQLFVDSTLTANQAAWSPAATFAYSWKCTAGGLTNEIATSASYVLQAADAGCLISLDVTGSTAGYIAVTKSTSNSTAVLNHFASAPVPTIIGDGIVGGYLTVLDGVWSANAIYQHQWYRNGSPVDGAVGPIYTLTAADRGTQIQVQVTVSRPNFVTDTAISATKFISLATPTLKTAAVVPTFKSSSVMTRGKTFKVVLARGGRNSQGLSTTVTASGACKATAIKQSFRGYRVKQVVGYTIVLTKKGTCVTKVSVAGSSSVNDGTRSTSIRVK